MGQLFSRREEPQVERVVQPAHKPAQPAVQPTHKPAEPATYNQGELSDGGWRGEGILNHYKHMSLCSK